ncbi:hypothetical protein OIU77_021639 [Salix suchowensis]|uniref:Uncharacterized protein n=1 Tax=Salix suchowensis TaxID=1278906 RepID=A0ABQ9CAN4_9ROSI|nr:hypothetical protein OIU77_021639 [Salix suchowensis]
MSRCLTFKAKNLKQARNTSSLQLIWGAGGGDVSATNKTCPDDVIQYSSDQLPGLPVTFSPANSEEDVIRVSTELNIKFSIKETCDQSPVWKIQKSTNPEVQWFVTTGGVEGNPGNWFKIEKASIGYKLVYCPEDICRRCEGFMQRYWDLCLRMVKRILSLSDALSPFLGCVQEGWVFMFIHMN